MACNFCAVSFCAVLFHPFSSRWAEFGQKFSTAECGMCIPFAGFAPRTSRQKPVRRAVADSLRPLLSSAQSRAQRPFLRARRGPDGLLCQRDTSPQHLRGPGHQIESFQDWKPALHGNPPRRRSSTPLANRSRTNLQSQASINLGGIF